MAEPTGRLKGRIRADFEPGTAEEVIARLSALRVERWGGQGSERVQAALVLLSDGDWSRFVDGLGLLERDWRDVLVAGGLAHGDWPAVLARELGSTGS